MSEPTEMLERLAELAGEFELDNLQPQIAACRSLRDAGGGFDVAVFGRFKAGKSSFLNHLMGREVLPVGVVPLTAVVTRLGYGASDQATLRFLDGRVEVVPLSQVALYVTESENPENRKRISGVDIALPDLRELAPMRFVDTPGLSSSIGHNTEAALEWLPNVGAALVAVTVDAPLSVYDTKLIEELRKHTPRIVLLLTKADLLSEEQRAEVLAHVQQEVRRRWDAEFPMLFYSVRRELSGLKDELMRKVLVPLARAHARTGSEILRHKVLSIARQTLDYVRVGLAAATQSGADRAALGERLAEERREFDLLRQELSVLASKWSADALESSLARLRPIEEGLDACAASQFDERFGDWREGAGGLLAGWRAWMQEFLRVGLTRISEEQRGVFCEPLHRAERHVARTLQALQDRLREHVRAVLGIALVRHGVEFQVREPSAPPIDVGYALDAALSSAGRVVPGRLFGKAMRRTLQRKTRWEVEKNLSRLAAAWQDRIADAISELVIEAEKQAVAEIDTLEKMVRETRSSEPRLRALVAELEEVVLV